MTPVFVIINWTQLFFIPALTMRCIADEKKNRTIELVLTKPIKTIELVMGKFFSCLLITSLAILLTIPYYITLAFLGEMDHGSVFLGYLGLLSISACHISIGLFASSLSRNAVTAFFTSLGISLCFQLLFNRLAILIKNNFIVNLLNFLSMEEHFDTLSRGILDSRDFIYFGSICILFLTLTKFFICKSRF
jgi:ABC-2 type transport system permease protein